MNAPDSLIPLHLPLGTNNRHSAASGRTARPEVLRSRHLWIRNTPPWRDVRRGVEADIFLMPRQRNVDQVLVERPAGQHEAAIHSAALGPVDADGEAVIDGCEFLRREG